MDIIRNSQKTQMNNKENVQTTSLLNSEGNAKVGIWYNS